MRARSTTRIASLAAGLLIGAGGLGALAACSNPSEPSPSDSKPSTSGSSSPSGSPSSGLTASPTPSVSPIAGECGSVLPVTAVDQLMGTQLPGTTAFIVGTPEPGIDRISYLNCRYGIPPTVEGQPAPVPSVEVGVSAYGSPASAQSRVQGTIEAYRAQGATTKNVPVGSLTGTVLVGSGDPTIVVASGNKTVAVTVVAALVTDATRDAILSGLAQRALTGAGG